jgi:hypothetical protein
VNSADPDAIRAGRDRLQAASVEVVNAENADLNDFNSVLGPYVLRWRDKILRRKAPVAPPFPVPPGRGPRRAGFRTRRKTGNLTGRSAGCFGA